MSQEYIKDKNISLLEIILVLASIFAFYLMMALVSFNPSDPSWSQAAWNVPIHNICGKIGAWFADIMLFTFGVLAYTLPPIILFFCWSTFAQRDNGNYIDFFTLSLQIIGILALLLTSCSLAAIHFDDFYYFTSGGVIGSLLSNIFLSWFNSNSATLVIMCIWLLGLTLFTGWSWLAIAEKIGALVLSYTNFISNRSRYRNENNRDYRRANHRVTNNISHHTQVMNDDYPLICTSKMKEISSDLLPWISTAAIIECYDKMEKVSQEEDHSNLSTNHDASTCFKDKQSSSYMQSSKQGDMPSNIVVPLGSCILSTKVPVRCVESIDINYPSKDAWIESALFSSLPITMNSEISYYRFGSSNSQTDSKSLTMEKKRLYLSGQQMDPARLHTSYNFYNFTATQQNNNTLPTHTSTRKQEKYAQLNFIPSFSTSVDRYNSQVKNVISSEIPRPKPTHISRRRKLASHSIKIPLRRHPFRNFLHGNSSTTANEFSEYTTVTHREDNASFIKKISSSEFASTNNPHEWPTSWLSVMDNNPIYQFPMCQKQTLQNSSGMLPEISLLTLPPREEDPIDMLALEQTARLVESRLADYRVKAKVVEISPGPVITRFELDLAPGVKVARISNLSRDLARSISAIAVRVVEVIPGKPYVGLELPNKRRQMVYLREVLDCDKFRDNNYQLALVLGKDIGGQTVIEDLSKMPHLLVAGTTGSGKSVGINAMILSILYKVTPKEVRFIMIDPKMLELSAYEGIPHLLTEVITDMKNAVSALSWCVYEMDRRYKLMSALGLRNLASYNKHIERAKAIGQPVLDPFWKPNNDMSETVPILEKIPYIVVIVDEFADLMITVGKKVEELITRLAQKARAAGIHLVLATQRPSVDVITGLIKANIPTRIAFNVSSKIDSRTILDQPGAESLLGMGDMLYLAPNSSLPVRVHGAFVHDEEVYAVVRDWKDRGRPQYIDCITDDSKKDTSATTGLDSFKKLDPLFDQAVAFVIDKHRASISGVQRQFRIGYNRAARIIEQMESQGMIGSLRNNGNREVLSRPSRK